MDTPHVKLACRDLPGRFEEECNIHEYSRGEGTDNPLGSNIFTNIHVCHCSLLKVVLLLFVFSITVMILSFRTDKSGQTVQTQIRLLLEEQSDRGLHCLLFHRHLSTKYPKVCPLCLNFRKIIANFFGVLKFRRFTVY